MKNPLVEAFELIDTGKRRIMDQKFPLLVIDEQYQESNRADYPICIEYRGRVTLGLNAVLSTEKEKEHFRKRAIYQFVEAMYGPFREQIMAIERALYENDLRAAREETNKLYRVMFQMEDL